MSGTWWKCRKVSPQRIYPKCAFIVYVLSGSLSNEEIIRKRNRIFDFEQKKQRDNVGRVEKIEVRYMGTPNDATMVVNKNLSTPFNCAQRKIHKGRQKKFISLLKSFQTSTNQNVKTQWLRWWTTKYFGTCTGRWKTPARSSYSTSEWKTRTPSTKYFGDPVRSSSALSCREHSKRTPACSSTASRTQMSGPEASCTTSR